MSYDLRPSDEGLGDYRPDLLEPSNGDEYSKRMSFVSPGGKRRASMRKASLARAGGAILSASLATGENRPHNAQQRISEKKTAKKERKFGKKSACRTQPKRSEKA